MKGRDLSRYAREDFQRLAGDFRIEGGKALLEPLTLEYEHASAKLRGDIALETGELSLAGEIVLSDAVDAELAGAKQGRRRVIPIHGISGTVQSPRISVDRTVVAQLITSYAARDLGRRLEERVGPGAGEAIGGILEELLRGAPERR